MSLRARYCALRSYVSGMPLSSTSLSNFAIPDFDTKDARPNDIKRIEWSACAVFARFAAICAVGNARLTQLPIKEKRAQLGLGKRGINVRLHATRWLQTIMLWMHTSHAPRQYLVMQTSSHIKVRAWGKQHSATCFFCLFLTRINHIVLDFQQS